MFYQQLLDAENNLLLNREITEIEEKNFAHTNDETKSSKTSGKSQSEMLYQIRSKFNNFRSIKIQVHTQLQYRLKIIGRQL